MTISNVNDNIIKSNVSWNTKYYTVESNSFVEFNLLGKDSFLQSWAGIGIKIYSDPPNISKVNPDYSEKLICDIKNGEIYCAYSQAGIVITLN